MSAHTPGPWEWQVHDKSMASLGVMPSPGYGTPLVLSISPCPACTERATEFVWGKCGTPSEDDARLIAAAPDLLAALEGANAALNSMALQVEAEWRDHDKAADRHEKVVRAYRETVRQALAKARGAA